MVRSRASQRLTAASTCSATRSSRERSRRPFKARDRAEYPLLFAHDQSQPLGVGKVSDSSAGLLINGKLVMGDANAQRAYQHLKAGSLKGLSIGFTIPDNKADIQRDGTRVLKEIRLHEVSLVPCPADLGARVTSVKSAAAVLAKLNPDDLGADDRAVLMAALKKLLGAKNALCSCDCEQCMSDNCEACSDPDCTDPNCEANQNDAAETLAALKALARELAA